MDFLSFAFSGGIALSRQSKKEIQKRHQTKNIGSYKISLFSERFSPTKEPVINVISIQHHT
jgi:hypothetical protein